jgi:hypothetical protein
MDAAQLRPIAPKTLTAEQRERSLHDHAAKVVGQTFMGTLLKQMRSSPYADNRFSGGSAGSNYAALLDMHISEIAGQRLARNLSEAIARTLGKPKNPIPTEPTAHVTTDLRA